ncbi:uncharacterized protein LOC134753049 [Cydia strobilella]|uniref:uncharacterized protein LOC134753049 n=1 Tax=Cydia strobilella TaxID=1100964 RepID=UPI003007E110
MELEGSGADTGGMSLAPVKEEPENAVTEHLDLATVKEEGECVDEEECVKEECEDSTVCGVSEAAMLAGLYTDHVVKDDLVLGPERPHRPISLQNQKVSTASHEDTHRREACCVYKM